MVICVYRIKLSYEVKHGLFKVSDNGCCAAVFWLREVMHNSIFKRNTESGVPVLAN